MKYPKIKFHESNISLSKEMKDQCIGFEINDKIEVVPIETKKQGKRIFFVSFFLVIIFAIITGFFLFFGKNSKTLFLYAINQEYANFISSQSNLFNSSIQEEASSSTLTTEGSLDFTVHSKNNTLKEFEKYSFDYVVARDYQEQNLFYQLQTYYDEKTLVDVRTYGTKNILYLELKNIFSKYISVEVDEYEKLFEDSSVKRDDIEYLIQSMKNLILESLQENDFVKSREKIDFENKRISTSKISYLLNEENFKESYEFVLNGILKDDKFLEILSEYTDKETEDVKQFIEEEKNDIENKTYLDGKTYELSIYFKGIFNEPLKYVISSEKNNLEYLVKNNEKEVVYKEETKEKMHLHIKKNEIAYTIDDEISLEGNLTFSDKKFEVNFEEKTQNFMGTLMISNQDKYKGKIKLTLKNNDDEIILEGNYQNKIGEAITLPNDLKENSIPYDKLTEEHYNEIMENILNNEVFGNLIAKYTENDEESEKLTIS